MNIVETILEFKLIDMKNFSLSVYNLLLVVIIFFAAKGIVYSLDTLIKKRLEKEGIITEGKGSSLSQIFKYIIYVFSLLVILESLGIDVKLVFGIFATLGLGLGFALQDVFKDLISGIIILFEGNVSVGDILEVDGLVGTVKEVKLRTSLIRTRDGIYMVIPNSRVVNEKVINWSTHNKKTRFNIKVGVAYGSDVEKVKELLLEAAFEQTALLNRPSPVVVFKDFGDSALQFELYFWTESSWEIEPTKSNLRFDIDKKFRANNIQIPFPQRDVHVFQK